MSDEPLNPGGVWNRLGTGQLGHVGLEGYILHTYGDERHLRSAVASALTIRRYDRDRPIALYTDENQREKLLETGLEHIFSPLVVIPEANRSIVGFKHHLYEFHPFDRNLFVDSDMVWCRNPDALWKSLSGYEFTATGQESADFFFGGPKDLRVVTAYLSNRRRRTLRRFGVTYLPRVQAGMIYSGDYETCRRVCEEAQVMLDRKGETHFQSRLSEGRSEESCEWSLALAMARMNLPIYPWRQAQHTPQLDYVSGFVQHDPDFLDVSCRYFNDPRLGRLREFPYPVIRDMIISLYSLIPGRADQMWITPFALHFGWLKYKPIFQAFADRLWTEMASATKPGPSVLEEVVLLERT